MIIILSGAIGRCCGVGGKAWVYMQYLIGLQALGHDVFYLEDCGDESWVYKWETDETATDIEYPASYVRSCLEPIGFQGKWIYRAGDRAAGMKIDEFRQICLQADLLIVRANPIMLWRNEYDWPSRRIFIDVDPGFTQMSILSGDTDLAQTVQRCERLFTFGQRIGKEDCAIPTAGRTWFKTLPPVSLQKWQSSRTGPGRYFTSLMDWRGFNDVIYSGVFYGQKDREFPKFIELPRLTDQELLIGLLGAPMEWLSDYGWKVVPGGHASRTPWLYHKFIQESRAEFSVAKHAYVETKGGWISDRSACYLASGRPALVQDTGQGDCLPIGEGIITFSNIQEALKGIETINGDYEHQRRSARALAEKYFDSDKVLSALLEEAMA